jgi:RNAse (barnase) inhibitor barstar
MYEISVDSVNYPLFRLIEEEALRIILKASDIDGFFDGSSRVLDNEVRFIDIAGGLGQLGREFPDAELQVMNFAGEVIGSYYIGTVRLGNAKPGDTGSGLSCLASFGGYSIPYPAARSIWRRWALDRPIEAKEWTRYPMADRGSWLHVAQNSWFRSGRGARRYRFDEVCVIDGGEVLDGESFYCAIGEAVNGPGGYFGSNLDALADCLRGSRTGTVQLRISWPESETSKEAMGADLFFTVVDVLREFDAEVELL